MAPRQASAADAGARALLTEQAQGARSRRSAWDPPTGGEPGSRAHRRGHCARVPRGPPDPVDHAQR
eukprot:12183556-Alexandrium_andersonii.AAC.1